MLHDSLMIDKQAIVDVLDACQEVLNILKDDSDGPVSEMRELFNECKTGFNQLLNQQNAAGIGTDKVPSDYYARCISLLGYLQFRSYLQKKDGN